MEHIEPIVPKNQTITDCITHTEDCLKKAMDLSSPLNKSSAMIAELYNGIQLLQSQLAIEAKQQNNKDT